MRVRGSRVRGFTMIEMLLVVIIIGALAALAIPNFQRVVERARLTKAIADLIVIGQDLNDYALDNNGSFPPNLATVGRGSLLDPWGRPYRYLRVPGTPIGQLRKDRFLVPVNSDFDLYSMGPDGASQPPFTAGPSRDDIVRANDGGFVGRVTDF